MFPKRACDSATPGTSARFGNKSARYRGAGDRTFLNGLGACAFGIDLSPGMVAEARRRHPSLRFEVGSLADLPIPDASLGGVVAWYSIIHTPDERLPGVFAEFARVLAAGGWLLTAFQIGDERAELRHAYGHDIELDAYRRLPERVAELLGAAGLHVQTRVVRDPEPPEKTPQAYLFARSATA
jgi:Methylase involved in ubiquinone/menaquinone biosynthesis